MKPFFVSRTRVVLLEHEASLWLGTPFVPHAEVRKHGVDCVHLCAGILKSCGHLREFKFPKYSIDGGKHNERSLLESFLDKDSRFNLSWKTGQDRPELFSAGDVLSFRIGRSAHHAALLIGGATFIHCLFNQKVMFASLSDPIFKRTLTSVYTPVED